MKIALIVCITLVVIVLISCISSTVEKCNRNKWKAKNPEAFKDAIQDKENN